VVTKPPHQVLGISPNASYREARVAYRRLAQRFHPDVAGNSELSSAQMAEINDAWRWYVERESGVITSTSAVGQSKNQSSTKSATSYVPPLPQARVPWRFLIFAAVVAIVVVVIADTVTSPATPGKPDQVLSVGSCVTINAQRQAVEVSCADPHEAVVGQFLATDQNCPINMEPYQDRQGMGLACVVRVGETASSG